MTKQARDFDKSVGGGVDRDKLPAADFVDGTRRRFPIVTPQDVRDAVSSFGRADPPIPMETFKRRLIAICRRKGAQFMAALPQKWKDEMRMGEGMRMEALTPVEAHDVADLAASGGEWRLFHQVEFAEPPEWIPYLPKPGRYQHPRYGEIVITPERTGRFVTNFKNKVYQDRLPVDAEHEPKVSGATGWIVDMRQNEDGSAEARVEWTDRGRALIGADRFRYFSPEWYDEWADPATGEKHTDVAIGGALTTRPFFKDRVFRPLVANEQGLLAPVDDDEQGASGGGTGPSRPQNETGTDSGGDDMPGAESVTLTEEQARAFAELQEKVKGLEEEVAARKASEEVATRAAEETTTALKAASERIQTLERVARRKRFMETAADWHESAKHVALLETLADSVGEDSEAFKSYIELQRATAEQLRQSGLFKEFGSDASGGGDDPVRRATSLAAERARTANISLADAQAQVFAEQPDLYAAYATAAREKV